MTPSSECVFVAGLACAGEDRFWLRQMVLSDSVFERALLGYLVEELGRAGAIVIHGGLHMTIGFLARRCSAGEVTFNAYAKPVIDLQRLSRLYLKDVDGRAYGLAAVGTNGRLWDRSDFSEQYEEWQASGSKPASEDELSHARFPSLYRMIENNRLKVKGLIKLTMDLAGRVLSTDRCSAQGLLVLGHKAEVRREWEQALKLYEQAKKNAETVDERDTADMRISMIYKRNRRYVEALEIWNRLVSHRVTRAMRELVLFYEKIDPDPAKVRDLAGGFMKMARNREEQRWFQHKHDVSNARLGGKPPPPPPPVHRAFRAERDMSIAELFNRFRREHASEKPEDSQLPDSNETGDER